MRFNMIYVGSSLFGPPRSPVDSSFRIVDREDLREHHSRCQQWYRLLFHVSFSLVPNLGIHSY